MKKGSIFFFGFLLFLQFLFVGGAWGQVTNYSFSSTSGTYSPISGGTAHNSTATDDANYNFTLPFTFTYNGTGYTVARPTTNGFLVLGSNAPSTTQYTPLSSGSTNFAISGFGADLSSIIRSEVIGSSPNRVYVCQWSSVGRYSSGLQADGLSFQIRLYETTNKIEVIYGGNTGTSVSSSVQVGLRGSSTSDFNNRTSTTSWTSNSIGSINSSSLTYSSSVKPISGLTYTWSIPSCFVPTTLISSSISYQSATIAWTAPATGTSPSGYDYEVRTSGAAGSGATGLVASGTTTAPTVSAALTGLTGATAYSYYVRSNCGSGDFSSWTSAGTFTTTSCAIPTGLVSSSVTSSSATITWLAPASGSPAGYEYEVRTSGAAGSGATGLVLTGTTTAPTVTTNLTGLTASTAYSVYVRSNCYTGFNSAWTSAVSFTTSCATALAGSISALTSSFCTSGSTSLTASGYSTGSGSTYQWESSIDAIFSNPVNLGSTLSSYANGSTGTITTTTYYRLKVICSADPSNPSYSNVVIITVNTPSTVTPPSAISICTGNSTTLTASGASTYTWSPSTGLSGTTGATVSANPNATTTYSIVGVGANGCTSPTVSVTVSVNPTPSAITIAQSPSAVCAGSIATLTASGGILPSTASDYSVQVTSGVSLNTVTSPTGTLISANVDDVASSLTNIGFTFNFAGVNYTQFWVNSNGVVGFSNAPFTFASNSFSSATNYPLLLPFFDDLGTNSGGITYKLTGTAPNRILTIDFQSGVCCGSTSAATIVFQVVLTETTNTVRFIYNNGVTSGRTGSAGIASSSTKYISFNTSNNTFSTSAESNSNVTLPSSGTSYLFTPPSSTFAWTPTTDLYTDLAATTAYSGTSISTVYAKNTSSTTYAITSTSGSCSSSNTISTTINSLPTITLGSLTPVCVGATSTSLTYTATSGSPNQYTIDYNSAANSQGFTDVSTYTTLPSSPITLVVPAGAIAGTYNGTITVRNSSTGCPSTAYTFSVTINEYVTITTQPTNQSAQIGANASFSVVATGTNLTYQWQEYDGTTYTNINGATSSTLTITSVISNDNGRVFRCVVSGTCGFENSSNASLTASSIGITTQPADATICNSGSTTLSMVTSGTINNYQWQISTDNQSTWSDVSGATNATLALSGLSYSSPAKVYRCNLNNGTLYTNGATVTVYDQVAISSQPSSQTICTGTSSVSFSVTATGSNPTYQWQVSSDNGSTWANVASGGSSATYTITNPADALNGSQYKVIVTGSSPCTAVTSNAVTLNVIYASIASSVASGCINSTFTLSATLNGNPTSPTYSWACPTTGSGATTGITTNPASITATATGSFVYTLTAGSTECPTITKTISLVVNSLPTITTVTATPSTVCSGAAIALIGASVPSSASSINLGSGTSSSSGSGSSFLPGSYGGAKTQYLIKASELTALGLIAGNITSVGFEPTNSGQTYTGFQVWINSTTATALTTTFLSNGTQVYLATATNNGFTPVSNSVNTLAFGTGSGSSSSFNWDGTSNIVITFSWSLVPSASTSSSTTMKIDSPGFVCGAYDQTDNVTPAAELATIYADNTVSNRPKFIIGGQVGSNQTSSLTWLWNSTPAIATATGSTTETNTSGSATTKTYTVTATNATTGCSNTATTSAITINPAPISPTATNSSQCGTASPTCSITGTGASGNTFKWYLAATGGTALVGQTANSLSSYPVSATTSFYVSESNGTCESPRVQVDATVSVAPAITASASVNPVCSGSATSLTATSANTGYSYVWNNSAGNGSTVSVNPTSTTTYTVTGTDNSGGANNGCVSSATIAITANALPSAISLTPSTSSDLCIGDVKTIVASGGVGSEIVTTVLNENFNAATNNWTTINSSTSGTPANAAWTLRANSYVYSSTTFNSNDNSQFYMSNSDAQGSGGTTLTTLTSPAFSTLNSTTSILNFYHYFKVSPAGRVQYSLDGTNFTTITTYTSTVGSNNAFTLASINLPAAALNKPVVYIRFRFEGVYDWYWAIDNVSITNSIPQISWLPTTALFTNAAATTAYTGNPTTVYAKPTSITTYTATATNSFGCSTSASVAVTVATPSTQPLATNDYVWRGTTNTDWSTLTNWVKYDGAAYPVASTLPSSNDNVFIPQNNTCVVNQPSIGSGTVAAKAVFIESSATVTGGSGTLEVKGDFTNNGTFTAGTGTVSFTGTTAQQITGATTFYNLTENNSAGLTLNSPLMVSNGLTMTAGNITTSLTNLLTLGNSAPATLTWTNGKIVGPMKRWMAAATNSGASSSLFPLGNATRKAQASIEYTTAPTTAGYLEAKFIASSPASAATNAYATLTDQFNYVLDNVVTEGYWEIKPSATSGVDGGAYTVNLEGENISLAGSTNASYTDVRMIKSPDPHSSWILQGDHGTATGANADFTVSRTGMSGYSFFAMAFPSAAPLPVELVSFAANCEDNNTVSVNWTTASEHNSAYYSVEKSRDGLNWNILATKAAAGNSTQLINYSVADTSDVYGTVYYRLTQMDLDGASKVYDIVSTSCTSEKELTLLAYPNPSNGQFTLKIENAAGGTYALEITDIQGKAIEQQNIVLETGTTVVKMNPVGLRPGVYVLQFKQDGQSIQQQKIVIE